MRQIVALVLAACFFSTTPPSAAQTPARDSQPDRIHSQPAIAPFPTPEAPDTATLAGTGLNQRPWPVDRPLAGGAMRKDPGSREWHFVRAMSDEEMRTAHQRYLEEMVAKHGNEPRDIMVQVNDSLDRSEERRQIGR